MSTATVVNQSAAAASQHSPESMVTWFEIPATDFERAVHFYEAVFGIQLKRDPAWPGMAIFPYERPAISGCIVQARDSEPAAKGVMVYLNCNRKLDDVLARTNDSGQPIVEPKNHIPGVGWIARIIDTEGNCVGLHSVV
jgi:uncharacterized protein